MQILQQFYGENISLAWLWKWILSVYKEGKDTGYGQDHSKQEEQSCRSPSRGDHPDLRLRAGEQSIPVHSCPGQGVGWWGNRHGWALAAAGGLEEPSTAKLCVCGFVF